MTTYRQTTNCRYQGLALGYVAGLVAVPFHGVGANIIVRIMAPFGFLTGVIVPLPALGSAKLPPARRSIDV